jgi:hypothetical protein
MHILKSPIVRRTALLGIVTSLILGAYLLGKVRGGTEVVEATEAYSKSRWLHPAYPSDGAKTGNLPGQSKPL